MASNEYHRNYYWMHKQKRDARCKDYYKRKREKILIKQEEYRLANKDKINDRMVQYTAKTIIKRANNRFEIRQKVLEKLGGICVRCGFSDWRALQIDHINDDGYAQRKKFRTTEIYALILSLSTTEIAKKYQLLCANCNWIKKFEHDKTKPYGSKSLKLEHKLRTQQKITKFGSEVPLKKK